MSVPPRIECIDCHIPPSNMSARCRRYNCTLCVGNPGMHTFDTASVRRQRTSPWPHISPFSVEHAEFVKCTAAAIALLPAATALALTRLAPVRIEVTRVVPRSSRQAMRR
jgi:hypothetical protein